MLDFNWTILGKATHHCFFKLLCSNKFLKTPFPEQLWIPVDSKVITDALSCKQTTNVNRKVKPALRILSNNVLLKWKQIKDTMLEIPPQQHQLYGGNLLWLWSPQASVSWSSSNIIFRIEYRKSLISRHRHSLFSLHLASNNAQWWASHNLSVFRSSWTGESFVYLHDTTIQNFNLNSPGHTRVLFCDNDRMTVHYPTYYMATCQINK